MYIYGTCTYCTYMRINILNVLIMDKLLQGVQGFKYFVHAHTHTHTQHTYTHTHTHTHTHTQHTHTTHTHIHNTHTHTHTHKYTQHNTTQQNTHTQIKNFDGKIFKDWVVKILTSRSTMHIRFTV